MCTYLRPMAMAESQDPTSSSSFFSWRYEVWAHRRRMASLNNTSAPIPPEESRRWVAETIWNLFMETNMPSFPSSLSFFPCPEGLGRPPWSTHRIAKCWEMGLHRELVWRLPQLWPSKWKNDHENSSLMDFGVVPVVPEIFVLSKLFGCTSKSSRSGKPQHAGHAEAVEAVEAMAGRPLYSSGPQGAIDSCSFGSYSRVYLISSKRGSWSHACSGCDFHWFSLHLKFGFRLAANSYRCPKQRNERKTPTPFMDFQLHTQLYLLHHITSIWRWSPGSSSLPHISTGRGKSGGKSWHFSDRFFTIHFFTIPI